MSNPFQSHPRSHTPKSYLPAGLRNPNVGGGQLRIHQKRKRSDEYATPEWLWRYLDDLFHLDIDVAASHRNHLCGRYFTRDAPLSEPPGPNNALEKRWFGRAYCNPPYSFIYPWVKHAHEQSLRGATVVMLLPCWLAEWFTEFVLPYADYRFLKKRLVFNQGQPNQFIAYFDSMVCVFPKERSLIPSSD